MKFKTTITGCARCGGVHRDITVADLTNPYDDWKNWACCPNTKEPILIKITPDAVAALPQQVTSPPPGTTT